MVLTLWLSQGSVPSIVCIFDRISTVFEYEIYGDIQPQAIFYAFPLAI